MRKQGVAQNINTKSPSEVVQGQVPRGEKETIVQQEYTIKGVVRSEEDNELLPGVTILIKGTIHGTNTDANGQFEFPQKLKVGDVLTFSYIGFKTKEYRISDAIKEVIEIRLKPDYELDSITVTMGGVCRVGPDETKQSGFRRWWQKVKGKF